jgi:hypothetical protein
MRIGISVFASLFMVSTVGTAGIITFDDLTTRNNFGVLGISDTYQGDIWTSSGSIDEGWASATVSDPAVPPAPTPVSGQSYAWNWDGVQSLYITFPTLQSVNGAYFATLSSGFGSNASSITMYGYDASDTLIATSSSLTLSDTFQFLTAGFSGIKKLEIRANSAGAWFAVDNIDISGGSAVPEPSMFGMLAFAAISIAWRVKRRAP